MRTRKAKGRRGMVAAGGGRAQHRGESYERRAPYEPAPAVLALLRGTWEKRAVLDAREREAVWSMLQRIREGALTDRQIAYARDIGKRVGVGYDDPALDAPRVSDRTQPWGPLPLKPPGKA